MGGLVLGIVVEYLIRTIGRAIKRGRSRNWPTTKATVVSFRCEASSCNLATVVYTYHFDREVYPGTDKKPFWFSSNAEIYIRDFPAAKEITVRVKPNKPEVSIVP